MKTPFPMIHCVAWCSTDTWTRLIGPRVTETYCWCPPPSQTSLYTVNRFLSAFTANNHLILPLKALHKVSRKYNLVN